MLTGISPRAVKTAIRDLRERGLCRREGGRLSLRPLYEKVGADCDQVPASGFSRAQHTALQQCFRVLNHLSGRDRWHCRLGEGQAEQLGLPECTWGEAYERLQAHSTARQRHCFTKFVIEAARAQELT